MKSIKIHNIDLKLYDEIRQSSEKNERSIEQEIIIVLTKQYSGSTHDKYLDFSKYMHLWDETDLNEFEHKTRDLYSIDNNDW